MEQSQAQHKQISYGTYVLVWLGLLMFTGLTVTVAGLNLRYLGLTVAILIAAAKSSLVLNWFMHLKYESSLFKNMIFVAIFILAVIIGLTFIDISFR
jgi:cytochrome c oxidase subunit IV